VKIKKGSQSLETLVFTSSGNCILSFVTLRKGPWGGFTKKTLVALRPIFLFLSKANASIAFSPNKKTSYL
jgi:hypothetical protein